MWSLHDRLQVGVVTYLNAMPLYHRLNEFAPEIDLHRDYPSRLADQLRHGELDLALIPSIEYLRGMHLGYRVIPGFAIAARGPVKSVKLFCRVPASQIQRLALDAGSRTSQALTRVWLHARHGLMPRHVENHPLTVPVQESLADAILLIGDRAMQVPEDGFVEVIDLAEAWHDLFRLPFVFALWVVRPGVELGTLPEAMALSRSTAIREVDQIVAQHAQRLGLDPEACRDYLTRVLSYDLAGDEVLSLRQFARLSAKLGLAPQGADLVFYHRRCDLAARL